MKLSAPRFLVKYLKTGIKPEQDRETNRRIFMVNLFGLVGLSITAAMGVLAFIDSNLLLGGTLFCASAVYYIGHYVTRVSGNFQVSSNIILYSLMLLMIYLVQSGGVANTGPLWIFMVAPVSLFFGGIKRGLTDIGIFVFAIVIVMYFPGDALLGTTYSDEFKSRLLYSFLTVTFLSGYYEYSRQQSFKFMLELSNKYEQQAKIDPLTNLSNRRDAIDKLEIETRHIRRNKDQAAILLCDIDYFKKINDLYGHDAGDMVLVNLAKRFQELLMGQDTVARWGGEEFLILLPQTNKEQAKSVADKLQTQLKTFTTQYQQYQIQITISIGISELNAEQSNIDDAIKIADENLYMAKENGRNCYFPQ